MILKEVFDVDDVILQLKRTVHFFRTFVPESKFLLSLVSELIMSLIFNNSFILLISSFQEYKIVTGTQLLKAR